jgi:hypothetical protein
MNIFSSIYYYSFSPHITNCEREQQLWLQFIVKGEIYVIFGILKFAVQAQFAANVAAGGARASVAVENETIRAGYVRPATVCNGLQKNFGNVCRISISILFIAVPLTIVGIFSDSTQLLMASTSLFVISLAIVSATPLLLTVSLAKHTADLPTADIVSKYAPMTQ